MIAIIWRMGMDEPMRLLAVLGVAMSWHVWRGGVITLRIGEVEVIVRCWRRRW